MTRDTGDWIPTVCYMCYSHCGIKVRRQNGLVIDIRGDENNPHSEGKTCAKGKAAIMGFYDPYRVKTPLRRTNPDKGIGIDPKWVEITWEEALEEITERLKGIRQTDPRGLVLAGNDFRFSRYHNDFLSSFGSPNHFHSAAHFCGNVLHTIHWMMEASFFAEVDYSLCNYCLFVGCQEGFMVNKNSTPMAKRMAEARQRGMKLVVVDPVCSYAASKADEWIPIRPGTDGLFALALLNVLVNELGLYDVEFIKRYTNGPYLVASGGHYCRDENTGKPLVWDGAVKKAKPYDEEMIDPALEGVYPLGEMAATPAFELLKEHLTKYSPEVASQMTTISAATIRRIAREFGQAARIGSTIIVDGQELPYRPAALQWTRGAEAHKGGTATGFLLQLVNVIVGCVDMPGGLLGNKTKGPYWGPRQCPDGLIVPSRTAGHIFPYPPSEVAVPQYLDLKELFPVGCGIQSTFEEGMVNREKYRITYQPEMMLHINSNVMMTTWDPKGIERAFKQIPFFVSISFYLNETTAFADLVLPDTHFLEMLLPFPNYRSLGMMVGPGPWYWPMAQPVVEPSGNARAWPQVLLTLSQQAGFANDFYRILNLTLNLREPYRLMAGKQYTFAEIADTWARSFFGPEHDLEWFSQNGVIKVPKKVEELYPRAFLKGRIPIYLEHYIKAGQDLQRVTKEMGIDWDTSDYQPLPGWRPCPAHQEESPDHDLYAVNFKVPFHTFSFTAQNPWLDELAQHHPYVYKILIHEEAARKKGIKDGDSIWVESPSGKVSGQARVTQCIHPEVVGIAGVFGHWAEGMPIAKGKGAHFNSLLAASLERIDTLSATLDACAKVKVFKA